MLTEVQYAMRQVSYARDALSIGRIMAADDALKRSMDAMERLEDSLMMPDEELTEAQCAELDRQFDMLMETEHGTDFRPW